MRDLQRDYPWGVGQDHVRIILLQNWAVALNVWTSSQHDSLVSNNSFRFESIELIHVCLSNARSPSLPGVCLVFLFNGFSS